MNLLQVIVAAPTHAIRTPDSHLTHSGPKSLDIPKAQLAALQPAIDERRKK
jgi:hypothetical protein